MAKIKENKKGFKIIEISRAELVGKLAEYLGSILSKVHITLLVYTHKDAASVLTAVGSNVIVNRQECGNVSIPILAQHYVVLEYQILKLTILAESGNSGAA